MYRSIPGVIHTLDPVKAYTIEDANQVDLIYSSYSRYHPFRTAPYVLEPNLGAEPPRRRTFVYCDTRNGMRDNKRGEEWEFRIRPGLRFQDDPCFPGGHGREVVAADFLYAFRRMADPANECPIINWLRERVLGFDTYGADPARPLDYDEPVGGLVADPNDPYRFRIRLHEPYPQLKYLMAMHFTAPVPREAVERYGRDFRTHPVGCGPYVLREFTPRRRLVLDRNPSAPAEYFPAEAGHPDAGKRLPLNDRVVSTFVRERVTAWNLFVQGYLDRSPVTRDNYSQVLTGDGGLSAELRSRGVTLFNASVPNVWYFCFQLGDPVWGGQSPRARKLRQAVSLAIDGQEFIDLVYQGRGVPAQFPLPPEVAEYDPAYRNPYRRLDLRRARDLLREAGCPDGIDPATGGRLVLHYDNSAATAESRQFTALVERSIERIGISVEPRITSDVVLRSNIYGGRFQFTYANWVGDYPDAENFVGLLYGPNSSPGPNHAGYSNPEFDRLFEQLSGMDEGPARSSLVRRMRDLVAEDCPWIPLMHDTSLGLSYDWLHNSAPHGFAYDLAKYWRVDAARRHEQRVAWNRPNYVPAAAVAVLSLLLLLPGWAAVRERRRRGQRRTGAGP